MPEQKQPLPVAQAIAASTDSIELVQSNGVVEFASPVRIVGAAAALGVPELDSRFQPLGPSVKVTITYNADDSVNTVTETATGAVTTYTYNADGTPATESRVQDGVTTVRTFGYSNSKIASIA